MCQVWCQADVDTVVPVLSSAFEGTRHHSNHHTLYTFSEERVGELREQPASRGLVKEAGGL